MTTAAGAAPPTRTVSTNGVDLRVTDVGEGFPVVLCHGFPELAHSWRHQIDALAAAGYRVLAPDQRGYGGSSRPDAIEDYDIVHLTDDVVGLLDDIGAERAVVVGHDWGSMVTWALAQRAPERLAGVVGMSVPFMPRPPAPPTQLMKMIFADTFFYMLYFQEPGVAEAELDGDPQRCFRRMFGASLDGMSEADLADAMGPRDGRGFVDRMPEPTELPAWLDQATIDHYAAEFTRSGFRGPLNWYRNLDRNWELMADHADTKVTVPALFVAGAADPVLKMGSPDHMGEWVTDLRGVVLVPGAGHWVQQEAPEAVNAALVDFLAGLDLPAS